MRINVQQKERCSGDDVYRVLFGPQSYNRWLLLFLFLSYVRVV